jgi:hypothetical protein
MINRNTLLHVSTLLSHLQGELSVVVTLRLHFIVEWESAVDCILCTGGVKSLRSGPAGPDHREFTPPVHSTQSTAHSHSNIKCNLNVRITKKFSLKTTQQGRNM